MGFLDIRIEKTERAIKEAFMELRREKPVEKIRVKELCDRACINKSTLYAHCLSLVVHAGQSVKQGQLIGYVGSTGRSSGNHCHFEIRRNGSYIAPQNVFNRSKYR